jgi:hypothetical protein
MLTLKKGISMEKEPFRAIYKSTGAVMINREPETDEEFMYMQQVAMEGLTRDAIKSGKNIIFPDESGRKHGRRKMGKRKIADSRR